MEIENLRAWGHNPLTHEEERMLNRLAYAYGADDYIDPADWSAGKRPIMEVLGGHSIEGDIADHDVDLASELLSGEFSDIEDVITEWWREHSVNYHRPYTNAIVSNRLAPTGEKLARRIAKDLQGDAKEEFLHRHSLLLARCKVNGKLRISVSPIELLMISNSGNIESCHSIGHEYYEGNIDYVCDSHTVVAYYYKNEAYSDELAADWPFKTWRQLIYLDIDAMSAAFSRHYHHQRDALGAATRKVLFDCLAAYHNTSPKPREGDGYILDNSSRAYIDSGFFNVYALEGGDIPTINIQRQSIDCQLPICPWCDNRVSPFEGIERDGARYHDDCYPNAFVECAECGQETDRHDMRTHNGEQYCDTCYSELFATCSRCFGTHRRESMKEQEGNLLCQVCWEYNNPTCQRCQRTIHRRDARYFTGDVYCEECFNETFFSCSRCGLAARDEHMKMCGGQPCCQYCAERYGYDT